MPSFKKASFNSNRDIKQNIRGDRGDGGDGDGPQNNTSCRFQKRGGGKNMLCNIHPYNYLYICCTCHG